MKSHVLALLGILFLLTTAKGIVGLSGVIAFGPMMNAFSPSLLLLAALAFVATMDPDALNLQLPRPGSLARQAAFAALLGVPLAYAAVSIPNLPYGYQIDRMDILFGGLALLGFGLSILLTFVRDDSWGLSLFLVSESLMSWVEWQNRGDPWTGGNWGPIAMSPRIMALLLFAALFFLKRLLAGHGIIVTSLAKYYGLWAFFLFASSLMSPNPWSSFQSFSIDAIYVPLFFFLAVNAIRTRRDIPPVLIGVMLFSFVRVSFGGYGIIRHTGSLEFYSQSFDKVYQQVFNIDILGFMAALTVPLCMALCVHYTPRFKSVLFGAAVMWLLFLVLATETRVPIVGLATFPLLLLVLRGGHGRYAFAMVVSALFLLGFAYFWFFSAQVPLQHYLRTGTLSTVKRIDMWLVALNAMRDHPFFGIGLAQWNDYYRAFAARAEWVTSYGPDPHNIFLHYGSAGGIGALIGYCGIVLSSLWAAFRFSKGARDPRLRILGAFLFWAIVMYAVMGLTAGGITLPLRADPKIPPMFEQHALFWLIAGIAFALWEVDRLEGELKEQPFRQTVDAVDE